MMPVGVYRETRHPNGRSELNHPASSTRTVIGNLLINGCQLSVDAAASREPVTWLSPGLACSLPVDVNEGGLRVGRRSKVELTGADSSSWSCRPSDGEGRCVSELCGTQIGIVSSCSLREKNEDISQGKERKIKRVGVCLERYMIWLISTWRGFGCQFAKENSQG